MHQFGELLFAARPEEPMQNLAGWFPMCLLHREFDSAEWNEAGAHLVRATSKLTSSAEDYATLGVIRP
jgi:hypothetical protein